MATARTFGGMHSMAVCSTREPPLKNTKNTKAGVVSALAVAIVTRRDTDGGKAVTAATWLCLDAIAQRARVVYLSARSRACAVTDAAFTALSELVGQALSAS